MTTEHLQDQILACLGNNSYFDAAIAAIGTLLLQAAKDTDPALVDTDNYQMTPVPTSDISIRKKLAAGMTITCMPHDAQRIVGRIAAELRDIIDDETQRVLWNTVRLAFTSAAEGRLEYYIWVVYMTCPKENKHE